MFTGLVEEVGTVVSIVETGGNHRITIQAPNSAKELKQGNSIAVSGVCLTALTAMLLPSLSSFAELGA